MHYQKKIKKINKSLFIMKITENNIIGQLVAEDYHTASVFKSYGIDFCCKGNRSIGDVCLSKNMDVNKLIKDLNQAIQPAGNAGNDYKNWPLDLLADYIEKKHHRYVREKCEEIQPFLQKVKKVHGENHPELKEIENLFQGAVVELAHHMEKEEKILFPYIRNMVQAKSDHSDIDRPFFGSVENPVAMMRNEHDTEGDRFRQISKLTNNYTPPVDACTTYRVVFAMLQEFETDLHLHIHLENNILFPKAIGMENELTYA
jgi:regulator of cell morphogenesis and NO signaling